MRVKVVVNPYANRWAAGSRIDEMRSAFVAEGLDYDLSVTKGPGEGTQIARAAADSGFDIVAAAGGDGTISEIVNGLVAAAGEDRPTIPLGIVPIGTANDFSDMVDIPRELLTSIKIFAAGKTRQIDVGKITHSDGSQVQVHHFNNNCAVAMEPMVTLEHIKMTRLSGEIRYMVALIRALVRLKAWQMTIVWEGGRYEGPAYLLSLCNGPRTGGFYMAPDAKLDDGLFDFVFAPELPKRTVLAVLARLLRGTHIHHPNVTYGQTTWLNIQSEPGTPVHADGEIIAESATEIKYQILAGKLTLLVP